MDYVIYVHGCRGFYLGNTYTHQGECFPATGRESDAKRYTSKKRAENAAASLEKKCDDKFEVQEA